jgi:hypothetical protein
MVCSRAVDGAARRWQTVPMTRLCRVLLLFAPLAVLAGCAAAPPEKAALPEMTFSHLAPIELAVAQVEIVDDYTPPLAPPHVERQAPVAPEAALKAWAGRRLKASGGRGVARFVIRSASLTDVRLATTKGLKGAFTKDQSDRFEAEAVAELLIYEGGGAPAGRIEAEARHSRTIAEDASVNERRRLQYDLVEALMAGFDKEMEKNMRAHLARWLK